MSGLGHKRRFGKVRASSALPLIAEVCWEDRHVSKVPISGVANAKPAVKNNQLGFCPLHRFSYGRIGSVAVRFAIEIGALQVMLQSRLFGRL